MQYLHLLIFNVVLMHMCAVNKHYYLQGATSLTWNQNGVQVQEQESEQLHKGLWHSHPPRKKLIKA